MEFIPYIGIPFLDIQVLYDPIYEVVMLFVISLCPVSDRQSFSDLGMCIIG